MGIYSSPEVPPTEEAVKALLYQLVKPWLTLKHNDGVAETPSESQQRLVAKQVHAAVVLYNYYHLNQHTKIEFLEYDKFRSLALKFIPSIQQYMAQPNRPNLNYHENQLSIIDKAIMDACTISTTFRDASSNISNMIEKWPVTKVAVFLIDSNEENCFLQRVEGGFWSFVEKDIYFEGNGLESESKKVSLRREYDAACSAVKEVAGTDSKLKVLEDRVVHYPSQAKTATHFYIVQSSESTWKDKLVPINYVISCLKGHVIEKGLSRCIPGRAVDCYYVLPYAEIISKWWFSRSEDKRTPTNAISNKDNVKTLKYINKLKVERITGEKKSCIISLVRDHGVAKTKPLQDFQFINDAQRSKLSETALLALSHKKQKLSNQRPIMEGELTSCDEKIREIMQSGIGDCLGLKLEAVIDCFNEICQDKMQIQEHSDLKAGTPPNEAQTHLTNHESPDQDTYRLQSTKQAHIKANQMQKLAMTSSSMEVEESETTNIYIPEDWSEAADAIADGGAHTPTAFICGPKNSLSTPDSSLVVNPNLDNQPPQLLNEPLKGGYIL